MGKRLSMDHNMVIENLRHRLRTTNGVDRESAAPMSWAEAEMLLQVVEAFKRTQPVWYELFVEKGGRR